MQGALIAKSSLPDPVVSSSVFTTRLQKGGAWLDDMRALVRAWDDQVKAEANEHDLARNVLGKKTRSRSSDAYRRAFLPRFIEGNPANGWKLLRPLEDREIEIEIIRPAYYWLTARSEKLLYDFVAQELFVANKHHDPNVRINETARWITSRLQAQRQRWTPTVTLKVARGLLAALRDFGILEGASKKRISPSYLPVEAFAYIAFCLHDLGVSGEALVSHRDWRLFLMSPAVVERLFIEASQRRLLQFEAAGKIYRVEFPVTNLEAYADVVARREF
jgi:hypothetical protein